MPTPTKGRRFGGSPSHQRLIMANLATSLFEHGQITTTEAKAKRLRPYAEHLITKAKVDTVANRRLVVKVIRDKSVLHTLFTEIGPNYATRPGGYTRITKIGPRKGDNAPMAVIELVESKDFSVTTQGPKKAAAKKSAKKAATSVATSAEVADEAAEDAVDSAAVAEEVQDDVQDSEVAEHVEVAEEAAEDAVDSAAVAEETDDAVEAEEAAADAIEAADDAETAAEAADDAAGDAQDDTKA